MLLSSKSSSFLDRENEEIGHLDVSSSMTPSSSSSAQPYSSSRTRSRATLTPKRIYQTFSFDDEHRNQTRPIPIETLTRDASPPLLSQPTPTPDHQSSGDDASSISSSPPVEFDRDQQIPIDEKREELLDAPRSRFQQSPIGRHRFTQVEKDPVYSSKSILNSDGFSLQALKQIIGEQQRRTEKSGSTLAFVAGGSSWNYRPLTSRPASLGKSFAYSVNQRQRANIDSRVKFEPLQVASKPMHRLLLLSAHRHPSRAKRRRNQSAPSRARPSIYLPTAHLALPLTEPVIRRDPKKTPLTTATYSCSVETNDEEDMSPLVCPIEPSKHRPTLSSLISLKSTIKLEGQALRCRSANVVKSATPFHKTCPRFLVITDEEHRVESWYRHYPFIVGEDFLRSFRSSPKQANVPAYFLDDVRRASTSLAGRKGLLQGTPFDLNTDWKKFDLILISTSIYSDVIYHLRTPIYLINASERSIEIHQVNHHEDLKTQVTFFCRQGIPRI